MTFSRIVMPGANASSLNTTASGGGAHTGLTPGPKEARADDGDSAEPELAETPEFPSMMAAAAGGSKTTPSKATEMEEEVSSPAAKSGEKEKEKREKEEEERRSRELAKEKALRKNCLLYTSDAADE